MLPRALVPIVTLALASACGGGDADSHEPPGGGGGASGNPSGSSGASGVSGGGGASGQGGGASCATVVGMAPVADVRCGDVLDGAVLLSLFKSPTTIDSDGRPECLFGFSDGTKGGVEVYCGEAPYGPALDGAHKPSGAVVEEGAMVGSQAFSATSDSLERRVVFVSSDKKYTAAVRASGPGATPEAALSLARSVDERLGKLP